MKNGLILHTFESHQVRTHLDENGNPWFSAKDVCAAIEIAKAKIQSYSATVGRSRIGLSEKQTVGLLEVGA